MILMTKNEEDVSEGGKILKVDRLGRVRTPRGQREALLAEYERSGMSAVEFAKWSGIKYQTFATWLQKAGRAGGGVESGKKEPAEIEPMKWAEAVCEPELGEKGAALVV